MILTDTSNQPLALAIFAALGVIMGILYTLNYISCSFIFKNAIYRHTTQVGYVVLYTFAFFLTTYFAFDYSLKIYQISICIFFTLITFLPIYLLIKRHRLALTAKFDKLIYKVSQSKIVKRMKR